MVSTENVNRHIWLRPSIAAGNAMQLAGLAGGLLCIRQAAELPARLSAGALLLFGWGLIYLSCHGIAHWAVGRLAGIRFQGYTIAGANKLELYPPALRGIMARAPFFGVRTVRESLQAASPVRQALMWSAGVTSSILCPPLAAYWAWRLQAPGGYLLLMFSIGSSIGALFGNLKPKGDYGKARAALRRG